MKTNNTPVFLRTSVSERHAGPTALYKSVEEDVLSFAFIIDQLQ